MKTLLLVTDAWAPQINGVVRTLEATIKELTQRGWDVTRISPEQFGTVGCPGYTSIRLALPPYGIEKHLATTQFDAIHIATEGPLGWAARRASLRRGLPFTTAYHTNFPAYLRSKARIPESLTYRFIRAFHSASEAVMAPTPQVCADLRANGIPQAVLWGRGVDANLFRPRPREVLPGITGPVWLNVGRVSDEKGLPDFLGLTLPGSKVVVGDGPALENLRAQYPEAHFLGALRGEALARAYALADVFVFPSRTDTFGLVMAEAIASGVPVAAYPVTGPIDVVRQGETGILADDLEEACLRCLEMDRSKIADGIHRFSWSGATDQFVSNLRQVS